MQELTTGMRERGINIVEWIDREAWRRNISTEICEHVNTLYINIKL